MSTRHGFTRDDEHVAHQGLNWTWPLIAGQVEQNGLGGSGRVIGMGELSLPDLEKPQMATLLLGMRNRDNPDLDIGPGNIRAKIVYGVGGVAAEEFLCDWTFQQSVSVPAGRCTLTAIEVGGTSGNKNMACRVMLTAQLVAGPRSSIAWPTLTDSFPLDAGVPETFPPPNRARRLIVSDYRGGALSDLEVTIHARDADNLYLLNYLGDAAIRTEGVVIPGGTTMIEVLSPGGTALNKIFVCFLLDG